MAIYRLVLFSGKDAAVLYRVLKIPDTLWVLFMAVAVTINSIFPLFILCLFFWRKGPNTAFAEWADDSQT